MTRGRPEIDHIDPRWEEGRDYQLVCGLDCPLNYREEDWRRNTAKSNRFLPWRWVHDEVGVVPTEPGDLALFLVGADIETDTPGEWVLMEFLGEEWRKETKTTCAPHHLAKRQWEEMRKTPEVFDAKVKQAHEGAERWREENKEEVDKKIKKMVEAGNEWRKANKEALEERLRRNNTFRYQCTVTKYVSSSIGLTAYQRARGIDTSKRKRIDDNQ